MKHGQPTVESELRKLKGKNAKLRRGLARAKMQLLAKDHYALADILRVIKAALEEGK